MNAWFNIVGYQLVWLATIWGASHERAWLGPLAFLPFASIHLRRRDGRLDAWLLLAAAGCGTVLDSLYAATRTIEYASPFPSGHAAPAWIITLWAAFALTLRHSLRFLQGRWLLAMAFGAAGAPLAYVAAARSWQAVGFPQGVVVAIGALALGWAFVLPLLLRLAMTIEHQTRSRTARHVHV
jgi:hypothetical protein